MTKSVDNKQSNKQHIFVFYPGMAWAGYDRSKEIKLTRFPAVIKLLIISGYLHQPLDLSLDDPRPDSATVQAHTGQASRCWPGDWLDDDL